MKTIKDFCKANTDWVQQAVLYGGPHQILKSKFSTRKLLSKPSDKYQWFTHVCFK